jgi:hypothetical protein
MKNNLLPPEVRSLIPKLYAQEGASDPIVYVKMFNPFGAGSWFILEFDGIDTIFCYAFIHEGELGYQSLSELESMSAFMCGKWNKDIPGIERDLHFQPMPLSKAIKTLSRVEQDEKIDG